MVNKIFVNLPVSDLPKSKTFFEALGWNVNPQFSDDTAACFVLSESIYAMLLTHPKFKQFTDKKLIDAQKSVEVIVALGAESKEDVDRIVDAALRSGGKEPRPPQDYGFMFLRSFEDLDGHLWEVAWMNPAGMPQQ